MEDSSIPKFLIGTSLHERQIKFFNGTNCPYCGNMCDFVDSIEVYQQSYGMIYICRPCKAWVNCHNGNDQAFGFVAKKDLRDLRHEAHKLFDPLWQKKVDLGSKKRTSQSAARRWLSEQLGITIVETHIGMFDLVMCQKVIDLCKPFYLSKEEQGRRAWIVKTRVGTVDFLATEYDFIHKSFSINGMTSIEIQAPDKPVFYYYPKKQEGRWANKKKEFPVEDIELFIKENFKLLADE